MNLAQIAKADDKDVISIKNNRGSNLELTINIGDRLAQAKIITSEKGLIFDEWVNTAHQGVSYKQGSKCMRIAKHKSQVRQLFLDGKASTINDVVKLIPKQSEPPIVMEADPAHLGYTGAKPGTTTSKDVWHTPQEFTDAAREVMGSIDLDPFSDIEANADVRATRIFTVAEDAFAISWKMEGVRTCWMNPPYSKGMSQMAVTKFLREYAANAFDEAIVLMNSSPDTKWYQALTSPVNPKRAPVWIHTHKRISFLARDGKKANGNTKGQVFIYFGNNPDKFAEVFSRYGDPITHYARTV